MWGVGCGVSYLSGCRVWSLGFRVWGVRATTRQKFGKHPSIDTFMETSFGDYFNLKWSNPIKLAAQMRSECE